MCTMTCKMIEKSIKDVYTLKNQGLINLDCAIQRNEMNAWQKPEKADDLIDSIMNAWSINLLHAYNEENSMVCLDGKQRLSIIFRVLNDLYIPTTLQGELSLLNGKTFSLWPAENQNEFLDYVLWFAIHDLDDSDYATLFRKLQNGIPLTPTQKRRGEIVGKLENLESMVNDSVWSQIDSKLSRDQIENILMQGLIAWVNQGKTALKAKNIIDSMVKIDLEKLFSEFSRKFLYFKSFCEFKPVNDFGVSAQKRTFKKVHLSSILASCPSCDYDIKVRDRMISGLIAFFSETGKNRSIDRQNYNDSCASDTSGLENVLLRYETLTKKINGIIAPKSDTNKAPDTNKGNQWDKKIKERSGK